MRKQDANIWYILETETDKGPVTVSKSEALAQVSVNEAELTALLYALRRMRKASEIHVYTNSAYVAAGWTQNWLGKWSAASWKTKVGEPIAHKEIWSELQALSAVHTMIFHVSENHSYSSWFEYESKKERKDHV